MKKYANLISLAVATIATGAMLYFAWPILSDPSLDDFHWMIIALIVMVFIAYYQLLKDILKEVL